MTRDPLSPDALARLIDLAEDAVVTVGEDHRIAVFNRGAAKVFGYTAEEAIGRPLDALIPAAVRDAHRGHLAEFADGPAVSRSMADRRRVFGRRKDGREFPAEVTISKFRDGGRLFLSAIVRDVTERVRIEDELRRLNHELEERVAARTAELEATNRQLARKNEENETFVYSVSHDLRSPLVNLEGFSRELVHSADELADLLTAPGVPAAVRVDAVRILKGEVAESIAYIQNGVARLSGIIDALLRLSRLGRVHYDSRPVDVAAVVGRVVQSLKVTADQKGAEVAVGPLSPCWGDQVAVEQVFANLIGNALNYLDPDRPGRVEVGGRSAGPATATYFVRDNGVGIPPAYAPQLFQVFRRLRPQLAPGEGMGLVTVRRILDRLGGRVWFEPADGAGTIFFVSLPTAPPDAEKGGGP